MAAGDTNNEFGKILSGTEVAADISKQLTERVKKLIEKVPDFAPGLAIVQVGNREDSNVYIRTKMKNAAAIGINANHMKLPNNITQIELLNKIKALNDDPTVHGIIVQMPLDCVNKIDSHLVTDAVHPDKDVDGLNTINEGRVAVGDLNGFVPCTPFGCMELIKRSGATIAGSNAVVLGRSKIVGTPASELLKWHHATVTVCHSKTKNIEDIVSKADILVVGIGQPHYVKGSWVKKGAVVIDCGINSIPDATKKSGKRLVGDVDYNEARLLASHITPVPGGVGPMTVAMLMTNTVISAERAVAKIMTSCWSIQSLPLSIQSPVPSDIEISRSQQRKEILDLAAEIGIARNEAIPYGYTKAKLSLSILDRLKHQPNGHTVVITGMTPTSFGEGKTTTTLGLVQALVMHKNKNAIACIRQPSQGPTFGIKGGAAGGGYSQVIPMDEINLHLTGDLHAVTATNNLLAAQLEARMFHENTQNDLALYNRLVPTVKGTRQFSKSQLRRLTKLNIQKTDPSSLDNEEIRKFARLDIDPASISWVRVVDTNDRFLRKITVGQSPTEKGHARETSFSITVASEVMAILALATSLKDMKDRFAKIVVALNKQGDPVTADDLGATGAMTVLMKDAIQPTLMQNLEGGPVIIHAGPFANIAHGCSSIVADQISGKLVGKDGYVVTEAGFGSEVGFEKFCNIKCRASGIAPSAAVLVSTIRALKMHGGGPEITSSALPKEYTTENLPLVETGLQNLKKHISNVRKYGVPVVVAVNRFHTDTQAECELVCRLAVDAGAHAAVVSNHFEQGGQGAVQLAEAVVKACETPLTFKPLYPLELSLKSKIESIAKEMYGAGKVQFSEKAAQKLESFVSQGFGALPVCMSKTPLSLSGDPSLKNVPTGFSLPVNDVYLSAGAGFVVAMIGEVMRMPGLPTRPCLMDIDLDTDTGLIEGLF